MESFDETSIQAVLDDITALNLNNNEFVSVEFTDTAEFIVRYTSEGKQLANIPKTVRVYSASSGHEVDISVRLNFGPKIKEMLGDLLTEHPLQDSNSQLSGSMGGDRCGNVNENTYGTVSFYANNIEIGIDGGLCSGFRCTAGPALVSCNHVIARSDAGQPGEIVWTQQNAEAARLKCVIRFSCKPPVDVATATVTNMDGVSTFTIRTIGKVGGFRRPSIGEGIKKYGARTQFTTGVVTGKANINVGGRIFAGVFTTSGGFGCGGDSGSAVIANNGNMLGMFSWGDDAPCEQGPKGYFWTFVDPGLRSEDSEITKFNFHSDSDQ